MSSPKGWSHVNNTVVLTILTFRHIQCLHLMYAEIAWVQVSSGTQAQSQITLDPDYSQTILPSIMITIEVKN